MSTTLFKHSVTNFYLLLFFIGLSVSSIVLDIKYSNSNYIRIVINDFLITPIQYLASTPSTFFSKFVEEKKTIEQLKLKIEELEKQNRGTSNEIQLTDAIANRIGKSHCYGYKFTNDRFDCGSKLGFIQANIKLSIEREDLSEKLKNWLKEEFLNGDV